MKETSSELDLLISETLSDMDTQAANYATKLNVEPLDLNSNVSAIEDKAKYSLNKITSVAATFALIALLSVIALLTLQNSDNETKDNLNVVEDPVEVTTTTPDSVIQSPTPTTAPLGPVTSQKTTRPPQSVGPTTQGQSVISVAPPSNFEAYNHYKNAFGWYVQLRWKASTTPGVSYCYYLDLASVNNDCEYNENFTGTAGDFSVGIGNTDNLTFYLRAVTPDGKKSEVITASYQITS